MFYLQYHVICEEGEFDIFANLNAFYFFLLPDCCARISSTMLKSSGESGYPYRVPDLRGKAPSVSPLRMIFAVGFL